MSQELTVYRDLSQVADSLHRAVCLPQELRGKADDIRLIVYTGHELGLAPAAAIRSIHIIKGKPVLSSDLMVAVVLRSGLAEYFQCVESSDNRATYRTHRRGNPQPDECSFSLDDARRAQLVSKGGNWEKYPRRMLQHRAASTLARIVYPDVLAGCYTPDEAEEFGAAPMSPNQDRVIDAEVIEPDAAPAATEEPHISTVQRLCKAFEQLHRGADLDAHAALLSEATAAKNQGLIKGQEIKVVANFANEAKARIHAALDAEQGDAA